MDVGDAGDLEFARDHHTELIAIEEVTMDDIKTLADDIYRERILRSRRMKFEDKFRAGQELFEFACSLSKAGIRGQFPELDEAGVHRELLRRLRIGEELEKQTWTPRKSLSK